MYSAIDGKPKRTTLLRRVRNINETGRASLVVDRWSEDWKSLSYVLVEGPAVVLQYDELPLAGNPVIRLTAERTVEWHA